MTIGIRGSGFGIRASAVMLAVAFAQTVFAQEAQPMPAQMPAPQNPPPTLREGTVEQLVATALQRSPEILAARTAASAAVAQVTQAGLRPNPTLTATQMQMTGSQHQ